jgi:hypothetical protein
MRRWLIAIGFGVLVLVVAFVATAIIGLIGFAVVVQSGPAATPPPLIHMVNRSNTPLVLGPGVMIPACGSVSSTFEAYEAARMNAIQLMDGTLEVPLGALLWDSPVFAGLEGEVTVVVSSTAPLAAHPGVVEEADLPPCGGAPVGVSSEILPDATGPAVAPLP